MLRLPTRIACARRSFATLSVCLLGLAVVLGSLSPAQAGRKGRVAAGIALGIAGVAIIGHAHRQRRYRGRHYRYRHHGRRHVRYHRGYRVRRVHRGYRYRKRRIYRHRGYRYGGFGYQDTRRFGRFDNGCGLGCSNR